MPSGKPEPESAKPAPLLAPNPGRSMSIAIAALKSKRAELVVELLNAHPSRHADLKKRIAAIDKSISGLRDAVSSK